MAESVVTGMASAGFLLVAGFVLFFVGKACENGSIARNNAIGIRTRHTQASDEAWKAGHEAGGRAVKVAGLGMVGGAALAALSGLLALLGVSENVTNSVISALIITSAVWTIVWVLLAGKKANGAAKNVLRMST